jgi:hypothetical protein
LRYNFSFTCRNRIGKFALGRKITNIEFLNKSMALITTNDSRIRLINISDGKLIHKYKGLQNEESMIRASIEEGKDMIVAASEDGYNYIWHKFNKESNSKKNYACEFFKPFEKECPSCSMFVSEKGAANYLKKLFNFTTKIFVHSIIINTTVSGRIQVLLNCDEVIGT